MSVIQDYSLLAIARAKKNNTALLRVSVFSVTPCLNLGTRRSINTAGTENTETGEDKDSNN
jgi:hypothetical protein